jgi:ribonuclease R
VSHYVTPGSALDKEARIRGNSVYLADRVIPMLPERLSNGVCSLRPDENRLTRCAVLTYSKEGVRTGARFCKAVICSSKRYSYEEAFEVMKPYLSDPDRAWTDPSAPLPAKAWALGSRLRKRRLKHGSLDLDFPEVKVVLDKLGVPIELRRITHDESHQMIEEFMLEANEAVAEQLRRAQRPAIFRIHEDPDGERLNDLRDFLMTNGIRVGDLSKRMEMQKALEQINGRVEAPVLKLAVLKSMKRAAYHVDCLGHYGLAKESYLHFTSPIRRYADLIVHRSQGQLLFGGKGATPDYGKMQELAEHLGHTERLAAEAEMQSRKIKELAYFERIIKASQPTVFQAMVSKALRVGLFVEVTEVFVKGIVRAEALEEHGYYFEQNTERYVNRKGGAIGIGDVLSVVPLFIEQERGSVAFRLAERPGSTAGSTRPKGPPGKPGPRPSKPSSAPNRSGSKSRKSR